MARKKLEELRSQRWFGSADLRSFGHRSRMLQMGYERDDFTGKPIVGIINTWSDLAQCHTHFPARVEDIKRGIWQAGAFPVELPAISLSESYVKPTTMLYRNFLNPVYFEKRSFSSSGSSWSFTQSRSATAQGVWFRRASKASPRRIRSSALAWQ